MLKVWNFEAGKPEKRPVLLDKKAAQKVALGRAQDERLIVSSSWKHNPLFFQRALLICNNLTISACRELLSYIRIHNNADNDSLI